MAKTIAERQREYRQRRPEAGDNGERRLQCWINTKAKMALQRLARHHGVSQREILERLLVEADLATSQGMGGEEFETYLQQ